MIKIKLTYNQMYEILDNNYLYGVTSTLEEAHRVADELRQQSAPRGR